MWRGWFHDLELTAENMVTFNALVLSTAERLSGTWSARMIEIKHASHDSTVRDVRGVYRAEPGVEVRPAISVGEQSHDCVFADIGCRIDPECLAPIRALELSSPRLRFSGTLEHFGGGKHAQVWAIKSSDCPADPPSDIDLAVTVRAGSPLRSYGIIGNETPRPSAPRGITLELDQRTQGGPAPKIGVEVVQGSSIRVVGDRGDATCAVIGADGTPVATPSC